MRKLQRIADQNGGNRAFPAPGYDGSVDYVVGVLRKAGWQVSTPEFDVDGDSIRNVIAQTKTGDPDHVVMAGAHLDSVEDGPGMNGGQPGANGVVGRRGDRFQRLNALCRDALPSRPAQIALYLNLDIVVSPNVAYLVEAG
jgi:aminopeptidase S